MQKTKMFKRGELIMEKIRCEYCNCLIKEDTCTKKTISFSSRRKEFIFEIEATDDISICSDCTKQQILHRIIRER